MERLKYSGSDAEQVFDTWRRAVGKFPGEWFKIIDLGRTLAPSGPAYDAFFKNPGAGEEERRECSIAAFAEGNTFLPSQRELKAAQARLVRVLVFDDSDDARVDRVYQQNVQWLADIYARHFVPIEQVHWVGRSHVAHLAVPNHDVAVFTYNRDGEQEVRAATTHYDETVWNALSRRFFWQGPDGDVVPKQIDDFVQLRDDLHTLLSSGRYLQEPTTSGQRTPNVFEAASIRGSAVDFTI